MTRHKLVIRQSPLMQRRALLVQAGFRPVALGLLLGDPRASLGDLRLLRPRSRLVAVVGRGSLSPLLTLAHQRSSRRSPPHPR
jgi:hypothetical protein